MDYYVFLKQELVPAFGCTEPIAIAYCAAKCRCLLEAEPEQIDVYLSGSMIKNANSVTVPGTKGRTGIPISVVAGALLGDSDRELEVLEDIDMARLPECDQKIEEGLVTIHLEPGKVGVYVDTRMKAGEKTARVIVSQGHSHVSYMEQNGKILLNEEEEGSTEEEAPELSFHKIYDFAKTCDLSQLQEILDRQRTYNLAISKEGLTNPWGSSIGQLILEEGSNKYSEKMAAYAAAGSDARMSGCEMPVVINSGSGNQGITVSVPITIYAEDNGVEDELRDRALVLANLISLYIKQHIGKLSAYCGAVSAATGAITGIGYMQGASEEVLAQTVSNCMAGNSGIMCDGAKASCAMKIASSMRNAVLCYKQAVKEKSFRSGDGIVMENVDKTVESIGKIAREGMQGEDEIILREMLRYNENNR